MSYKHTAVAIILAGIAAGTVIALVGTFLWAETWGTALGVVFPAATLLFIIPIVIVIVAKS
jgi:hypothetical protein